MKLFEQGAYVIDGKQIIEEKDDIDIKLAKGEK